MAAVIYGGCQWGEKVCWHGLELGTLGFPVPGALLAEGEAGNTVQQRPLVALNAHRSTSVSTNKRNLAPQARGTPVNRTGCSPSFGDAKLPPTTGSLPGLYLPSGVPFPPWSAPSRKPP